VNHVPSGRPGHRVPHIPISLPGGEAFPSSTIDLCADGFALLVGPRGHGWIEACRQLAAEGQPLAAVPLQCFRCCEAGSAPAESDDPRVFLDVAAFLSIFGVEESGAVLCRPDGHNAFRAASAPATPARMRQALAEAFETVLCTAGPALERVLPTRVASSPSDLGSLLAAGGASRSRL